MGTDAPGPRVLPEDFYNRTRLDQTRYVAETWLENEQAASPTKAKSGKAILEGTKKLFANLTIPENTFYVMLSTLVRTPGSRINTQGRKKGFYLTKEVPGPTVVPPIEEEVEETKAHIEKEKPLYSIFLEWLLVQGYAQARDTSSLRNGDLGRWSNPDLTGIRTYETLGNVVDIELATIEVKPTIDNWQYYIFEAVSHRRFSNRCYFAFAHPETSLQKIDPDLKHYAEIFGVGILVLVLEDHTYKSLSESQHAALDEINSTDIVEYVTAPRSETFYQFRDRYLRGIGIESLKTLHQWGVQVQ